MSKATHKVGNLVAGVRGLGFEDIICPTQTSVYNGLIVSKIKEEDGNILYELYCQDGQFRKFHSREIIDFIQD